MAPPLLLEQAPSDTEPDKQVCCCDCCDDCCCCTCHIPISQAPAKRWQVVDLTLSTLTLGACGWYLQWYFLRDLWLYFAGAVFLALSCVGAIVTSSLGICCLSRHRTASLGGWTFAGCAAVGACLIAIAGPFVCHKAGCRARPDYCYAWDDDFYSKTQLEFSASHLSANQKGQRSLVEEKLAAYYYDQPSDDLIWYDDYWYDDDWYDNNRYYGYWYNYYWVDDDFYNYYWYDDYYYDDWEDHVHRYYRGHENDDDFFKDKCKSYFCDYPSDYPEDKHYNGNFCYSTGYQNCGKMFGSRFEASFNTGHGHWHGFDERSKCNRYFLQHLVLAKIPLFCGAIALVFLRCGVALATRSAFQVMRFHQLTELTSVVHSDEPQLGDSKVSHEDAVDISNPHQQYQLLNDDATGTSSTAGPANARARTFFRAFL